MEEWISPSMGNYYCRYIKLLMNVTSKCCLKAHYVTFTCSHDPWFDYDCRWVWYKVYELHLHAHLAELNNNADTRLSDIHGWFHLFNNKDWSSYCQRALGQCQAGNYVYWKISSENLYDICQQSTHCVLMYKYLWPQSLSTNQTYL